MTCLGGAEDGYTKFCVVGVSGEPQISFCDYCVAEYFELAKMAGGATRIDGGYFAVFAIDASRTLESCPPLILVRA